MVRSPNPPSSELAKHKVCHDMMALLLQLNGDLFDHYSDHELKFYMFSFARSFWQSEFFG